VPGFTKQQIDDQSGLLRRVKIEAIVRNKAMVHVADYFSLAL